MSKKTWISPLQKIALTFQKFDLSKMRLIHPYAKALWISPVKMVIPVSRAKAIRAAQEIKGLARYSDASGYNDLIGIGVHWQQIDALSVSLTIPSTKRLNVHSG